MGFIENRLQEKLKTYDGSDNICKNCEYYNWTMYFTSEGCGIGMCKKNNHGVDEIDTCFQFKDKRRCCSYKEMVKAMRLQETNDKINKLEHVLYNGIKEFIKIK